MGNHGWNGGCWKLGRVSFVAIACGIAPLTAAPLVAVSGGAALAQIIPDNSLGAERSLVTPNVEIKNQPSDRIDGGAIRGSNLFHSFQEFSIGKEQRVYFANPAGIERILTRVTGGKISEIFGTLGVDGIADLFLINPAGIIFGPNASLDVGGSFIASTADSVIFPGGIEFSATNPQTPPLLVMNVPEGLQFGANPDAIANVPEGLQFGANPGAIAVEGTGHNVTADLDTGKFDTSQRAEGLKVPDGKTLALVGGNLTLTGGNVTALGGQVELGSVAGASQVTLIPTEKGFSLNYSGVQNFGEIQLSQEASADVSGAGGNIQVQGSRVTLTEGSVLLALTEGEDSPGSLTVNASDTVELIGTSQEGSFSSGLFTETTGNGAAGDLRIFTRRLVVQDGAQASSSTFGDGRGGNLDVTATESVELSSNLDVLLPTGLIAATLGNGAPGNITLNTGRLTVRDGAEVSTSVSPKNTVTTPERGGDLTVNASESVELIGDFGLFASTEGARDGGNLTIVTPKLTVRDGAQVNVSTFGAGDAGKLSVVASEIELAGTVTTADGQFRSGLFAEAKEEATGNGGDLSVESRQLIVRDGAQISAATFGAGSGGTVTVNVSNSATLAGRSSDGSFPSGVFTLTEGSGKAGDLNIQANRLIIRDGAEVTASAQQPPEFTSDFQIGDAGNLAVTANDIRLDSGAIASASASGNGGNITVNTDTIVGLRNSDISANASGGAGGAIAITARGIFGLQERSREEVETLAGSFDPSQLSTSDITAYSDTPSLNGQVIFNTPDIDPTQGLVELQQNPIAPDTLIALGCEANEGPNNSWFINTNRGGLPANPGDPLNSLAVWDDVRSLNQGDRNRPMSAKVPSPTAPASTAIAEAQGWVWKEGSNKTAVRLTANTRAVAPYRSWQKPAGCDGK